MKRVTDKLCIAVCMLIITFTGTNCKKDKNEENTPPPEDRWEAVNGGRERNIGTANWSFVINNKAFFGSKDGDLHVYDFSRNDWMGTFNYPPGFEQRWNCAVAVHNNKAYIGNGRNGALPFLQDWWEFDPESTTPWRRLPDCPVGGGDGIAFIFDGKLYTALQIDERMGDETIQRRVYEFDIASGQWSQGYSEVGVNCGSTGFAFMLNNKLHFGAGYNNQVPGSLFTQVCAVFDPSNHRTQQIASFPVELHGAENANTFTLNGKGYVLGKDRELYEYDPAANRWREMNKLPENSSRRPVIYVHQYQNKFFGFTSDGKLYEYKPA